jgi:uncharacterized damage-inducible protein DinB
MRTTISLVALTVVVASAYTAVRSQTPAAGAQPATAGLRQVWDGSKRNLSQSAEIMPEADYGFRPPTAKSPDGNQVRTFGQILAHVAGANYVICAAAKGEKSPHAEDEFEKTATTRAAISKALTASLAYCDTAFATDDRKLAETIEMPFGMGKAARSAALVMNISHVNEHYGNLVTYFRIKGIVPPSSRR